MTNIGNVQELINFGIRIGGECVKFNKLVEFVTMVLVVSEEKLNLTELMKDNAYKTVGVLKDSLEDFIRLAREDKVNFKLEIS